MSYYRQGPFRPSGPVGIQVPGLTPYVKLLIIASVAVWVVQFVARMAGWPLSQWLGLIPALAVRGWVWQPVTYMFLHNPVDPFHILFNMLMLWMFGGELERFWGSRSFLRYYLVCGVGAGLCVILLAMIAGGLHAIAVTIGASGALFGIFVAYGMVFARRTILFMFLFPMQARTMAMIMVALSFFMVIGQPGSNVSHIAHLGGALTGYLYLKRAWRLGEFCREMRWKMRRRKFKMVSEDSDDRWLN